MNYLTFDSFSASAGLSVWMKELQTTKKYENVTIKNPNQIITRI